MNIFVKAAQADTGVLVLCSSVNDILVVNNCCGCLVVLFIVISLHLLL